MATIGFGIQIYGDFSGYSDIAIGAALILGFKLPLNFNKPYFAISPSDFWKRWHISLSSWLRDYLYIPLGGNRKSSAQTYCNLFAVMILGGLWHGAAVNFIIWGTLHGLYLAIHKMLLRIFPKISQSFFFKTKIGKIFSVLVTQYFVFLAWIPFRVHDIEGIVYSMNKFILLDFATSETIEFMAINKFPLLLIFLFFVLNFLSYRNGNLQKKISESRILFWFLFLVGVFSLIVFFYDGNPDNFIYFQF